MSEQDFRPGLVKKSRYEREAGINLRHVIFHKHRELEQAGAICRYGRHWMVELWWSNCQILAKGGEL